MKPLLVLAFFTLASFKAFGNSGSNLIDEAQALSVKQQCLSSAAKQSTIHTDNDNNVKDIKLKQPLSILECHHQSDHNAVYDEKKCVNKPQAGICIVCKNGVDDKESSIFKDNIFPIIIVILSAFLAPLEIKRRENNRAKKNIIKMVKMDVEGLTSGIDDFKTVFNHLIEEHNFTMQPYIVQTATGLTLDDIKNERTNFSSDVFEVIYDFYRWREHFENLLAETSSERFTQLEPERKEKIYRHILQEAHDIVELGGKALSRLPIKD